MIIFIFITGSKKSLFVLIVCVCGYLIWKNKSIAKKILNLLIALSLIFILINALFKVEFIYKIIGVRVESFINGLLMGTKGDDDIRYKFAELGIQYFMQNPILGVGIDNYRFKLLYDIGLDTYSHNNYVEILSNLGIIGFVSYYWIYIYILIRVFKEYIYANDKSLIIIGLLVMVSIVIMELGLITYDYPYMQVMILLCYKISYLHEDKYRQEVEVQNEIRNIK